MRFALATCITLFLGASAFAQTVQINPEKVVAKISSHFERDSELKLEGSGMVFRMDGGLYVMTSEHVVIPDNEKAVHIVELASGEKAEAEYYKSRWAKGITLLRLKTSLGKGPFPDLEDLYMWEAPDELKIYPGKPDVVTTPVRQVTTYGFPAGTTTLKKSTTKSKFKTLKEGKVLKDESVYSVDGLLTEFGMSGGPAFYPGSGNSVVFAGLLTHATYEESSVAFLIPGFSVTYWIKWGLGSVDFLERSYADLKSQFFSAAKPEIVRYTPGYNGGVKIEKRGDKFLILLPKDYGSSTGEPGSGLGYVCQLMAYNSIRQVRVTSFSKSKFDPKMTLHQFVAQLMAQGEQPKFEDYEEVTADQGLTQVPAFSAHYNQSANYRITATVTKTEKKMDYVTGSISFVPVQTTVQGWKRASNWDVSSSGFGSVMYTIKMDYSLNEDQNPTAEITLATMDIYRDRLAECESKGGVKEVVTVPAGKYMTCKMKMGQDYVWFGPVPFEGIVKVESLDKRYKEELYDVFY